MPEGVFRIGGDLGADERVEAALLLVESFPSVFSKISPEPRKAAAVLAEGLRPSRSLVARQSGRVCALACMSWGGARCLNLRFGAFWRVLGLRGLLGFVRICSLGAPEAPGDLLFDLLAVRGPLRGQGIGTSMLGAVESLARAEGLAGVRMVVTEADHRARALYESLGYVPVAQGPLPSATSLPGSRVGTTLRKSV